MARSEVIQDDNKASGPGPGDKLQAARIAMGLSLEDVANRMHLSSSVLQALEENDFEQITAPTFVKGYLRAYARMVSLDEIDIIQQYIKLYSGEDPPINTTSNTVAEISVNDARIRWTTYLVVIVLIVLLALWWWNKEQTQVGVVSLDADPVDTRIIPAGNETLTLGEVAAIEAASETAVRSSDNIINSASLDADNSGVTQTPAVSKKLTPVEAAETPVQSSSEERNIEPVAEAEAEPVTEVANDPVKSDQLHIAVHADTWADIKDASGDRLVYNLLRADQKIDVNGQAPFTVFFGNGHGVEVSLNSEIIDIAGHIKDDNTARLKVGSNP